HAVPGMRGDLNDQVQVAGAPTTAAAALSSDPDALAVGDPGRDGHVDRALLPVRAGEDQLAARAAVGLLDRDLEFGLLVSARERAASPPAAEHPAEQVLDVDPTAEPAEIAAEVADVDVVTRAALGAVHPSTASVART